MTRKTWGGCQRVEARRLADQIGARHVLIATQAINVCCTSGGLFHRFARTDHDGPDGGELHRVGADRLGPQTVAAHREFSAVHGDLGGRDPHHRGGGTVAGGDGQDEGEC